MKNLKIACFSLSLFNLPIVYIIGKTPESDVPDYLFFVYLVMVILTIVTIVRLARKLNRSGFGWGVGSLFFPWLLGFIIPFLSEKEFNRSSGNNSYSGRSSYTSTYFADKSCGACGKGVSLSSSAGGKCPHCGIYWNIERKVCR